MEFVFFVLNFKCNRIEKPYFLFVQRSPFNEFLRFSTEVELTY
jgi:hypothetical protein